MGMTFEEVYAKIRSGELLLSEFQEWVEMVERDNYSSGYMCGGIEGYCGKDR